jgi:2,5-diketo-D-gluconate reductase A
MVQSPSLILDSGVELPQLGLGTARVGNEEIRPTVAQALGVGYRLIDAGSHAGHLRF